jgi:sugar lactone lactonase YvrE
MTRKISVVISALALTIACSHSGSSDPEVVTIANVGGNPDGVTVAPSGNIYITDIGSGDIKQITPEGEVTTITNIGNHPDGIVATTESGKDILYVTDTGSTDPEDSAWSADGSVKRIVVNSKTDVTVSTFVDSTVLENPTGIALDASDNLYVADQGTGDVYRITVTAGTAGTPVSLTRNAASVDIDQPHGLTLITNSDSTISLFTTDQGSASNNIVRIDIPSSGNAADAVAVNHTADSIGGMDTGTTSNAKFNRPHGISTDDKGAIFVCDEDNNRVQIITPAGNVITFAGTGAPGDSDGSSSSAQFNNPRGLAIDSQGNLLICDYGNGKVKKIIR